MRHLVVRVAESTGFKVRYLEGARMYMERQALAIAAVRRKREHGRILCYHCFGQREFGVNDVTPVQFRRHLESALRLGYRFVPAADVANGTSGPKDLAITLDDGFKTVVESALPVLSDLAIPFTMFVVSEWPARREAWQQTSVLGWDDLERVVASGADIGSHSATHCDFSEVSLERAVVELASSRETLRERLGICPDSFAIPFGSANHWNLSLDRAARAIGYKWIYAGVEDKRPPATIGRTFVTYYDDDRLFAALLNGAYDRWEEWLWKY